MNDYRVKVMEVKKGKDLGTTHNIVLRGYDNDELRVFIEEEIKEERFSSYLCPAYLAQFQINGKGVMEEGDKDLIEHNTKCSYRIIEIELWSYDWLNSEEALNIIQLKK